MSLVAAIDPGIEQLAWAGGVLDPGAGLLACGLSRLPKDFHDLDPGGIGLDHASRIPGGFDVAIVERMFHYPDPTGRVSPQKSNAVANDLINLAAIGGIVGARVADIVRFVPARQWKGQLPKDVSERRIRKVLRAEEEAELDRVLSTIPVTLRHNVVDAVGIWCHFVGRKYNGHG